MSNTIKSNVRKLQRVQNFAARIIFGFRKFEHISQGIKSLKWLPIKDRLYLNDAINDVQVYQQVSSRLLGR